MARRRGRRCRCCRSSYEPAATRPSPRSPRLRASPRCFATAAARRHPRVAPRLPRSPPSEASSSTPSGEPGRRSCSRRPRAWSRPTPTGAPTPSLVRCERTSTRGSGGMTRGMRGMTRGVTRGSPRRPGPSRWTDRTTRTNASSRGARSCRRSSPTRRRRRLWTFSPSALGRSSTSSPHRIDPTTEAKVSLRGAPSRELGSPTRPCSASTRSSARMTSRRDRENRWISSTLIAPNTWSLSWTGPGSLRWPSRTRPTRGTRGRPGAITKRPSRGRWTTRTDRSTRSPREFPRLTTLEPVSPRFARTQRW